MPSERFAVIGDPIGHSLSPAMHTVAFGEIGLDATYEAIRVTPGQLSAAVTGLRRDGYRGFNVTIPHKENIGPLLDVVDPTAAKIGAINTVVNGGGRLLGYNTDCVGFSRALRQMVPHMNGGQAVVFGAGGSARAVIHALMELKMTVTVVARNPTKAEGLSERYPDAIEIIPADSPSLAHRVLASDLLVNTTPLGMDHLSDRSPLPDGLVPESRAVVFDLVYGRTTPLIALSRAAGCTTLDGLEMLVYQGAASFQLWTGIAPNIDVMREACRKALGEVAAC